MDNSTMNSKAREYTLENGGYIDQFEEVRDTILPDNNDPAALASQVEELARWWMTQDAPDWWSDNRESQREFFTAVYSIAHWHYLMETNNDQETE